jgi:hypothetical protein
LLACGRRSEQCQEGKPGSKGPGSPREDQMPDGGPKGRPTELRQSADRAWTSSRGWQHTRAPRGINNPARRRFEEVGRPMGGTSEGLAVSGETMPIPGLERRWGAGPTRTREGARRCEARERIGERRLPTGSGGEHPREDENQEGSGPSVTVIRRRRVRLPEGYKALEAAYPLSHEAS